MLGLKLNHVSKRGYSSYIPYPADAGMHFMGNEPFTTKTAEYAKNISQCNTQFYPR